MKCLICQPLTACNIPGPIKNCHCPLALQVVLHVHIFFSIWDGQVTSVIHRAHAQISQPVRNMRTSCHLCVSGSRRLLCASFSALPPFCREKRVGFMVMLKRMQLKQGWTLCLCCPCFSHNHFVKCNNSVGHQSAVKRPLVDKNTQSYRKCATLGSTAMYTMQQGYRKASSWLKLTPLALQACYDSLEADFFGVNPNPLDIYPRRKLQNSGLTWND